MNNKEKVWKKVQLARNSKRPTACDYINGIFPEFIELHGDRNFADDKSIIGGIGILYDFKCTIIAQQKGRTTEENLERNFGMPHPEGYRKALRLMKQAEKFNRPIITFIDTPGAYPGLGAEERGQGEAIAKNLLEMANLTVPVISIIIGEGGSGGALALGVGNKVYMLENSIYSILSPEGFATILWKDAKEAPKAAELMKLTATELKSMGIIDDVIKEPKDGAHTDVNTAIANVKEVIVSALNSYRQMSKDKIKSERYNKFRNFGECGRY